MEKGLKKLPVPPITRSLLKERWLQAEKAEKVEVNKDHYDGMLSITLFFKSVRVDSSLFSSMYGIFFIIMMTSN